MTTSVRSDHPFSIELSEILRNSNLAASDSILKFRSNLKGQISPVTRYYRIVLIENPAGSSSVFARTLIKPAGFPFCSNREVRNEKDVSNYLP